MNMRRTLTMLATTLVLGATAAWAGDSYKESFNQTYPLDAKGSVSLENVNGDVTVAVWDRSEVRVEAVKECESRDDLDKLKIDVTASASTIHIETRYPETRGWFGGHDRCGVDYTVTVPKLAALDKVELVNGDLSVAGAGGDIRAETVNGTVSVSDASGDINLETVNGVAEVSCASVDASQRIEIDSVNGAIELRLPAQVSARVQAETVNGRISNDFGLPVNKHQFVGSDLSGSIGAGSAEISLETVNGAIRILKK